MSKQPDGLSAGELAPRPASAPLWRAGTWPLWVFALMWFLSYFRQVPALFGTVSAGGEVTNGGFLALLGLLLLLVLALGVAVIAPGRLRAEHLGLTGAPVKSVIIWTVVAIATVYGIVYLGSLVSNTPGQDTDLGIGKSTFDDLMLVLGVGAVGPVAEEFAYRAVMFRGLNDGLTRWLSPRWAAIIAMLGTAAIFASAHTGAPPWHLAAYFALAFALAFGYWWTGSLLVAVVPHLLNNAYGAWTIASQGHASTIVSIVACLTPLIGLAIYFGIRQLLPREAFSMRGQA